MAEADAELDIGIKFDEEQFSAQYKRFLSDISHATATQIQNAVDSMKGAAAKTWGSLPFYSMHDKNTGSAMAAQAFLPSFAAELKKLGLRQGSEVYQSALMSAAYRSSIPDAAQRNMILQANGANALSPDSIYERILSTDYALMSQSWARHFIHTSRHKGLDEDKLKKLSVADLKAQADLLHLRVGHEEGKKAKKADYIAALMAESQKETSTFDFASMREEAVKTGIGHWIDPEKEHTAENFELIDKALGDIDEKAETSKKKFNGWGHELKGVLGTLTAIVGTVAKVGGAALGATAIAYKAAESYTVNKAAKALDNRRSFLNMSNMDVIETIVAGTSVGLGEYDIFNEIEKFSSSRESYKLLGQGLDALFPSLSGTFGTIMSGDDPSVAYKEMLKVLYEQLKDAGSARRRQVLMLLDKQGYTGAEQLLGYSLTHGVAPESLFSALPNRYAGSSYNTAELLTPQIARLNESLRESYAQMATDWEKSFGIPFKTWWDNTLKDKILPWFDELAEYWNPENRKKRKEQKPVVTAVGQAVEERNDYIEGRSDQISYIDFYKAPKKPLPSSALQNWFGTLPASSPDEMDKAHSAKSVRAQWDLYEKFAKYTDKDLKYDEDLMAYRNRVKYMVKKMKDTGLDKILTNKDAERSDILFLKAMQEGLYGEDINVNGRTYNGLQIFDQVVERALSVGSKDSSKTEKIIEKLEELVRNTAPENRPALASDPALLLLLQTYGGTEFTQQILDNIVNRGL